MTELLREAKRSWWKTSQAQFLNVVSVVLWFILGSILASESPIDMIATNIVVFGLVIVVLEIIHQTHSNTCCKQQQATKTTTKARTNTVCKKTATTNIVTRCSALPCNNSRANYYSNITSVWIWRGFLQGALKLEPFLRSEITGHSVELSGQLIACANMKILICARR